DTAVRTGKQDAVSHCYSTPSGNNDHGNLKNPVNPNGTHRPTQNFILIKNIVKGSQHNSILKKDKPGTYTKKNSQGKSQKGHPNIINGNCQKTAQPAPRRINSRRITVGNVLKGLVHIRIAQYKAYKLSIMSSRERTDQHRQKKNQQGIKQR